jgi:prolyl 4-hydroxylase
MPETPAPSSTVLIDRTAGERDYQRARASLAANDLDSAARWLELAAMNEHPAALTELAILYLHGFGRDADPAQAVQFLLRAEAAGGTAETPYLLAQIALGGVVLPRDPQRIDAWMTDSARRGYPAALRVAALRFGQREEPEYQQAAVACLQRATEARDPVSAALLADRLHAGRGIAADPVQALDLANELRAMGIPVELPATDVASESATPGVQVEPPWHDLHLVDSTLPDIRRQCDEPEIATCDGLLSDEECRYIIYSGARFLERSQVIHPVTGQPLEFEVRTSQDMAFVPRSDDAGIRILQLRMATMAGFDLSNCEPLTLQRYGPGDQYRPHRDYFFPSSPSLAMPGGQRHSTVCTYLNAVQQGGETVFPDKQVTVEPLRGRAVMFRNLHADGSPDPHSLHAGLPVLTGEKWLASCWIRVRSHRQF